MPSYQNKLKTEIILHGIMVIFGLLVASTFIMFAIALIGQINGNIARSEWAWGWTTFLFKGVVGFIAAWLVLMAVLWVARKIRNR